MYKDHPSFERPSDDTVLWRYMDFTKFVSLLDRQALFFARGDLLEDPFEGTIPKANADVSPQLIGQSIPEEFLEEATQARATVFRQSRPSALVNCWHENDYESAAMWKLYAKDNAGLAIRTSFNDFTSSLTDDRDIHVGRVKYIDYETDPIPETNIIGPFLYKRPSFRHEQEVRAIIWSVAHFLLGDDPSLKIEEPGTFSFVGTGTYSKVNLGQLVQEVVISPYADGWFNDLVESVAQRYGLVAPIRKSSLFEKPT